MGNRVKFLPNNIETECAPQENIFQLSKRSGVKIPTACNGTGACGQCRIEIIDGEDCLHPITKAENFHLGNVYFVNKVRLSCQCKFIKEGVVTVNVK